ncbi:MAG: InlB B-repeat-containing protein [Roseburia sp.]|nr:InlB B-repeat-containing protein [Roseburia sp.]
MRKFCFALIGCVILAVMPVMSTFAKISPEASMTSEEGLDGEDDPLGGRARASEVALSVSDSTSGYRHDSRFNTGYTIKTGIDVSKYQGVIDWNRVKADGVEFAIIRAGFRGYGEEGTLCTDPYFASNIAGATNAGIPVGVYFFSQAITAEEARAEANYVMSLVGGYRLTLPIVMDYEYVSGSIGRLYNAHLSAAQATDICKEFCRTVEARGYEAMVYANKNMLRYSLNASEISSSYQIWLANYVNQTDYEGTYTFWQFRSDGAVNGISGVVDMNFWYQKKPSTYSVAFDGNGATKGTMKKKTGYQYGVSYQLPKNTYERKGYRFNGWNTKPDGSGVRYKDKASIKDLSADDKAVVTLYAQWSKEKYSISYKLDGGTNHSGNPKSYYITTATITLKAPTRIGYTFQGWYSDSKYKTKVTKITRGSTGNKTLYAKWKANSYQIVYKGNGETGGEVKKQSACQYGKTYKLAENAFEKTGYVFNGWNTKADGSGKAYKAGAKVQNLSKKDGGVVTLYAQWKKQIYTIQYRLNGGKNHKSNPKKYSVMTATIQLANPTRKGYTFKGWYSDSEYQTKVTVIPKGSTGNIELYAKWTANKYTIVYDGNGKTSGSMGNQTGCKYGKYYTLAKNTYKKRGYVFNGWNTKADGSGKAYTPGQRVRNLKTGNKSVVTLYAQWKKK